MRYSRYFLPTLKETPATAQIASHRLMLRAGMIRQASSAGIYSWLPFGKRVLSKVENIVREEQDKAGCVEVLTPTIQSAELWRESGRYEAYGKEMLRITDRHDKEMLYGPTAEEVITDIFRQDVKSYRDLPKMLYQIQWKFRDEIRPRFGLMRGREFLMKDNYSFDLDVESATRSYELMYKTYLKTFERMGVRAIPVKADTGPIGGDLSHEFQILADTGESEVFYDPEFDNFSGNYTDESIAHLRTLYAASEEMHDPENCPVPVESLKRTRGIEVGHIFFFGTKYTQAMGVTVTNDKGEAVTPQMGSYGIGVSRAVAAIIEASHDDKGIIWPEQVAPFRVGLINMKPGHAGCDDVAEKIYQSLEDAGQEVFYDDRVGVSAGTRFADMDLIGLPWQVILGPRSVEAGHVELKNRKTGERVELSVESLLSRLLG